MLAESALSAKKPSRPALHETELTVWEERDRLNIRLDDKRTGRTILDLWDDEAREMFEDGFFRRQPHLHESVYEYAMHVGLAGLTAGRRTGRSVIDYVDGNIRRGSITIVGVRRVFLAQRESPDHWRVGSQSRKEHDEGYRVMGDGRWYSTAQVKAIIERNFKNARAWVKL